MDHKSSVGTLALVGIALILGSVSMVTQSGIKVAVSKPYSQAAGVASQSIRISYPNGGQTFTRGSQIKITVSGCDTQFVGYLVDKFKKGTVELQYLDAIYEKTPNGDKTHTAIIPVSTAPGSYYVLAFCQNSDLTSTTSDYSDEMVTIVAPAGSVVSPTISDLDTMGGKWRAKDIYHYNVSLLRKDASGAYQLVTVLPYTAPAQGYYPKGLLGVWPSTQAFPWGSASPDGKGFYVYHYMDPSLKHYRKAHGRNSLKSM